MAMKIVKVSAADSVETLEAIREAGEILSGGGLVAFPTETVYGVGACAEVPGSVDRLCSLKSRPSEKSFTLHIADKGGVDRYVPDLGHLERHFLRRVWPGPVTVIFTLSGAQMAKVGERFTSETREILYRGNSIGVRVPDHPAAQGLLGSVKSAVVASSANRSGARPATTAQEVAEAFDQDVDMVLDGGSTRYGLASPVVSLQGQKMTVLREGVLEERALRRMSQMHILFVCTGNTCRSPMAQGYCRQYFTQKHECGFDSLESRGYKISSAGIMASNGGLATMEAIEVCRQAGIDIGGHQSRRLTKDMVNQADYIYVMSKAHYEFVTSLAPEASGRCRILSEDGDIADPIGMDLTHYKGCGDQISRSVRKRLDDLRLGY